MARLLRGLALVAVLGGLAVLAGSAALQWWEPPETTPVTADVIANPRERVRVEVLNGGGVAGMARTATELLRDAGFDVVEFGNADAFDRDSSVVLARLGRVDLASMVADALAIPTFHDEPDSTAYVDITVLLGSTWDPSVVAARMAEPAQDTITVPAPEPGWRGVLSRLREWAEGLNQAGNQQ
ncbi:MAG: LytR C-terminal domain-containing protein [Gammaproteobacteria bacterium]|nr:LytR C-terminal domain-containing protein [Gammaproteobacteria bacterium]